MTYRTTRSVVVAATPAILWDYLQDTDRRGEWDARVVRARTLTPPPKGVRSRFTVTYRYARIESDIELEYIAWEPFERSATKAIRFGRGSLYSNVAGAWHFHPEPDDRTTWTAIISMTARGGPLGWLLERVGLGWYFGRLTETSQRNVQRIFATTNAAAPHG